MKFALARSQLYAIPPAVVVKEAFGVDKISPFAEFYDVFREMLRAVSDKSNLSQARDRSRRVDARHHPADSRTSRAECTVRLLFVARRRGSTSSTVYVTAAGLASPFDDAAVLTVDGTRESRPARWPFHLDDDGRTPAGAVSACCATLMPNSAGAMYSTPGRLGFCEERAGNPMAFALLSGDRF
jgi:hypothetical protein